ncbi:MAG: hypothetical protein ACI90U_001839 [Pseudomonadales bacterium]|jgi:hypothetical protein
MENKMKYLLLTALLLPLNSYASDIDCEQKTAELVASLVAVNLTKGSDDAIAKEAVKFCQSIVNHTDKVRAEEANSEFTEWLINGEVADKPGNKRLKRLK